MPFCGSLTRMNYGRSIIPRHLEKRKGKSEKLDWGGTANVSKRLGDAADCMYHNSHWDRFERGHLGFTIEGELRMGSVRVMSALMARRRIVHVIRARKAEISSKRHSRCFSVVETKQGSASDPTGATDLRHLAAATVRRPIVQRRERGGEVAVESWLVDTS